MPTQADAARVAQRCLGGVHVQSFETSPATIPPFGKSTLTWNVLFDQAKLKLCDVSLTLNGVQVPSNGSLQVGGGTYMLKAKVVAEIPEDGAIATVNRTLGVVTVVVDTATCFAGGVPEETVREMVRQKVFEQFPPGGGVEVRRLPRVEVDSGGVHVFLRLKKVIQYFPDLNVDVAFTYTLRAVDGNAVASVALESVDVDWPWWLTIITGGVSKIVEEPIDELIKDKLKSKIKEGIKELVDSQAQLPPEYGFFTIDTDFNIINFTACPREG